jgi:putative ABC transport system ATP-binding protein
MIEVKNVQKSYGKKEGKFIALLNINLKIPDGSTLAIVGKSGSGKSTLMHVMSGLDRVTDGSIVIDGKDLARLKPKAMDRFRATEMSFIFQSFFIEPNQTCYQNVMLPLEIAEVPRRKRQSMVKEALLEVELEDKSSRPANSLSGGQKQRLAIARAIVNKPRLIFADEPTGNLDSTTLGSTLIIVTHDHDLAARCAMQVRIKDGKIESMKGFK